MELKMFLTKELALVVKERSKPCVSYFVPPPRRRLFSTPPLKVYRGPSDWSPHRATLTKRRRWPLRWDITLEESHETIVVRQQRLWGSLKLFTYEGKKYTWRDDVDLIDLQNGHIIAEIRQTGSTDYGLVLTIYREGQEMMDIVVITAISMSRRQPVVRIIGYQIGGVGALQ
jgi:hypothetical protein